MGRWTNKNKYGERTNRGANWNTWRTMKCPYCGFSYRKFRMSISTEDVLEALRTEVREGKRHHITLRTLLGKCHEIKLEEWNRHLDECGVQCGALDAADVL